MNTTRTPGRGYILPDKSNAYRSEAIRYMQQMLVTKIRHQNGTIYELNQLLND